jgi:hypothetical protein
MTYSDKWNKYCCISNKISDKISERHKKDVFGVNFKNKELRYEKKSLCFNDNIFGYGYTYMDRKRND